MFVLRKLYAFEAAVAEFEKRNTIVIGASCDTPEVHFAWLNTPKNNGGIQGVTYPLIADSNRNLASTLGILDITDETYNEETGLYTVEGDNVTYRATYLIDEEGMIFHESINHMPLGRNVAEFLRLVDAYAHVQENGEVCPANWQKGDVAMHANREGVAEFLEKTRELKHTHLYNEKSQHDHVGFLYELQSGYFKSKRSRFITLTQADTKSLTNRASPSSAPYTSQTALNSVFDPNIRSARVPENFIAPVLRSLPINALSSLVAAFHVIEKSRTLVKKSLLKRPTLSVKTPCLDPSKLAPKTRNPPIRAVISGIESVSRLARSTNRSSAATLRSGFI